MIISAQRSLAFQSFYIYLFIEQLRPAPKAILPTLAHLLHLDDCACRSVQYEQIKLHLAALWGGHRGPRNVLGSVRRAIARKGGPARDDFGRQSALGRGERSAG